VHADALAGQDGRAPPGSTKLLNHLEGAFFLGDSLRVQVSALLIRQVRFVFARFLHSTHAIHLVKMFPLPLTSFQVLKP
jgi:hypothetical protein